MIPDDPRHAIAAYYQWARENAPEDIGYPHSDPVRNLLGTGIRSAGLTDAEAEFMNRVLGALKRAAG